MSQDNDGPISKELLDILACPACDDRPPLELTEEKSRLRCTKCKRQYPIADGRIPQLLVEEAIVEKDA